MLPRFLAAAVDRAAGTATLGADETHHLTHVMRLGAGAEVAVFDGRGREYRARVERLDRGGAVLRLIEPLTAAPEPAVRVTLAQAVLKGEKMDDVVRDATMMGVAAVQPLIGERTVGRGSRRARPRIDADHTGPRIDADHTGPRIDADHVRPRISADHAGRRWRRIAVASAKQCGRAVVPEVAPTVAFGDVIAQDRSALRLLLAEPSARAEATGLPSLAGTRPESATLLVGPEGGWSSAEVDDAVRAGWTPVTLGRRTLRADAVAIVAVGVLQYLWGDL